MKILTTILIMFPLLCNGAEASEFNVEEIRLKDGRILEGRVRLGDRHQHLIIDLIHTDGRIMGSINTHEFDIVSRRVVRIHKSEKIEPIESEEQSEQNQFDFDKQKFNLEQNQIKIKELIIELNSKREERVKIVNELTAHVESRFWPEYQEWFKNNKENLLTFQMRSGQTRSGFRARNNLHIYNNALAEWQRNKDSINNQNNLLKIIISISSQRPDIGNVDWSTILNIKERQDSILSTIKNLSAE